MDDFQIGADYQGKDAFDAHVHAAAVACNAHILLTANVVYFLPTSSTSRGTRTSRPTRFSPPTSS